MGRLWSSTVVLALVAALGACSGKEPLPPVDGPIVQPGKPGEESEILDEPPRVEAATANEVDIAFVQMMIPHHAQALEMARLAPKAGGSAAVRTLADRIEGAQGPEIVYMAGWLTDRELDAPTTEQIESGNFPMDHGSHGSDHSGTSMDDMPGMASTSDIERLKSARGAAFDRLFLQLMVAHHQGALDMVDEVVRDGSDQMVNELATGIAADQTAEIQRMRDLLSR